MQYLYQDGENLVFMDTQSFDQIPFSPEQVGDARKFLKENLEVERGVLARSPDQHRAARRSSRPSVTQCDPGHEGRHRLGRHEARDDRDRCGRPGARSSSRRATSSGSTRAPAQYVERV